MSRARQVLRVLGEVARGDPRPPPALTYDEAVKEAEKIIIKAWPIDQIYLWLLGSPHRYTGAVLDDIPDPADKKRFRAWVASKKGFIERTGGFA